MAMDNALLRLVGQEDRLAQFDAETFGDTGAINIESYIAYGDGKEIPFRSFVRRAAFAFARDLCLVSPESTITALDVRKLAGLTGAMLARQSRVSGTVIDVLANEFIVTTPEEAEKSGAAIGDVKVQKADQVIERILVQYGDDSVQELEYATVLFNSVSNIATKIIEDRRLGGFIEQSSRYVLYDERDPVTGAYAYYREPTIMAGPHAAEYLRVMDRCFALYSKLAVALKEYYATLKPMDTAEYAVRPGNPTPCKLAELTEEKEIKEFKRVYGFDLKTRACDTARILLPACTLTNLAMVANGRVFEHLLKRLYSSDVAEFRDIGIRLHATLQKTIPRYVQRAKPEGEPCMKEAATVAHRQIVEHFPEFLESQRSREEVAWVTMPHIVDGGADAIAHLLAASYYPFVRVTLATMIERIAREPLAQLTALLAEFSAARVNRRDRAERAWEIGASCTFEMAGNFGIFRDLHRHRMLTQQRQLLTPHLGFSLPDDVVAVGLAGAVRAAEAEVVRLYDALLATHGPEIAQYCVLFGHHVRWTMGFNLREAQHLLELRTIPQGHPDYRRICQRMSAILEERAPWLAESGLLRFVDDNEYPWARAAAEARQSQKLLEKGLV